MWTCKKCRETVDDDYEVCWNCGTGIDGSPPQNPDEFEWNNEEGTSVGVPELPAANASSKQVLSQIPPIFHSEFRQVVIPRLQSDEFLLAGAPISEMSNLGFVVISSYRAITSVYAPPGFFGGSSRPRIRYQKSSAAEVREYLWYPTTSIPLAKGEIRERQIEEIPLKIIQSVDQKPYNVYFDEQHRQIRVITVSWILHSRDWVLEDKAGQRIYNLLQEAIRKGGISAARSGATDHVAQLERLVALHRSGALSDQEFKAAKAQILGLG